MRKYLLLSAIAFLCLVGFSQTFTGQQTTLAVKALAATVFNHERIDSEKARNMRGQFVRNGRRDKHEFTKFNRDELIATLQSMQTDTVKFVIGAFTEDEANGREKNKPVIMLQVAENEREQPGGNLITYSYMMGAICPPPHGGCTLE